MEEFLNDFYYYYFGLNFAYRFVSGFIAALLLSSIVLFLFILLTRAYKNFRDKRIKSYTETYEDLFTNVLFEHDWERDSAAYKKMINDLKVDIKGRWKRRVILRTLYNLHVNLVGQSASYLEQIYFDVGLSTVVVKKLKFGSWHRKALAIKELSEFNVISAASEIEKFADHPKKELRSEAQFAIINLKGIDGLKFIPKLKTILSEWQQLSILEQLKKMDRSDMPDYTEWLKSPNFSVRVFALKLISYFNIYEVSGYILQLLNDDSDKVKIETFNTLRHLQISEFNSQIALNFSSYSHEVRVAAVKALEIIGEKDDQYFLFEQVAGDNYELVLHAAHSLIKLGFEEQLKLFKAFENPFNRRIIQHALDERI